LGRQIAEYRDAWDVGKILLGQRYDTRSRLTEAIDGNGRKTLYQYDSHNRLTQRTNADSTVRSYSYDTEDNLTRLVRENGFIIDYEYDSGNRMSKRLFKDASEVVSITDNFEYNGLNALTKIYETGGNTTEYELDSRGLTLVCRQIYVNDRQVPTYFPTKTFQMVYNIVGQPSSMQYPGGRTVTFSDYNHQELLGSVATDGFDNTANASETDLISYSYMAYGRVSQRTFANNIQLNVGYDQINRVKTFLHRNLTDTKTHVGFVEIYDKVHNKRAEIFLDDNLAGQ